MDQYGSEILLNKIKSHIKEILLEEILEEINGFKYKIAIWIQLKMIWEKIKHQH